MVHASSWNRTKAFNLQGWGHNVLKTPENFAVHLYNTTTICCSVTQSGPTVWDPTDCSTPGLPVLHQLLELAQTHVHWVGDAIQPSRPLSLPSCPAFNLSQHQGLFQWVSFCFRWPKYWSFSCSISPFNNYSGLISFTIDWFDLLAIQGTLR